MNDESGPDVSVQGAHNGEMGSEVPMYVYRLGKAFAY